MQSETDRFAAAIEKIDAANRADPNREVCGGEEHPKEVLYSRRMTERLDRFDPNASEPLRIAARAQHIRRWESPRDAYPMGRKGYHLWRTDLYRFHADVTEEILRSVGYGDETIQRVRDLLMKKRLKSDPQMQTLEDVICLVFLEHYFADFAAQHEDEKVITILQRTWRKMSERGREAALRMDLPADARRLIERALAGE